MPDLRTNEAWLLTCSEFEIPFSTVENRLTERIPKSFLTSLQIWSDIDSKYERKN